MMSCKLAFIVFVCSMMDVGFGYSITIGRSSKADYIVASDPSADVYNIVQQAMTSISKHDGGVLTFEAGVYMFQRNLKLPSNISIVGSGIKTTTLKLANTAKAFQQSAFIYFKDVSKVEMQNLTLDGNQQNNVLNAILSSNTSEMSLLGVQIQNFMANGIMFSKTRQATISNSYVENSAWNGVKIINSSDIVLKNNVVSKSGDHGFVIKSSQITQFDNNTSNDNGNNFDGCGILFKSLNITATNVFVSGYSKAGVCVTGFSGVVMSNSIIKSVSQPLNCIALTNETIYFNYSNVMCGGKLYGPKVHSSKDEWTSKIVKIVIPSVIGIIGLVCIAQLIALWRNQQKEKKLAAEAEATANTSQTP